MSDSPATGLSPAYRMPVEFGPAPGPRNVPNDVPLPVGPECRTAVAFTVPVREADVSPLVPAGLTLDGETVTVTVQTLSNLRWLAGRGYSIVSVMLPVRWTSSDGELAGDFLAVLWENMADPVITGREELGFPKLFADIEVVPYAAGGTVNARASWDATTFFTAGTTELTVAAPPAGPPRPVVTRRFLPGLVPTADAAVDELAVTDGSVRPVTTVVEAATGAGEFEFRPVTWEQLPTQYRVVNALAAVRQTGPASVRVTRTEGYFSGVRSVPLMETR